MCESAWKVIIDPSPSSLWIGISEKTKLRQSSYYSALCSNCVVFFSSRLWRLRFSSLMKFVVMFVIYLDFDVVQFTLIPQSAFISNSSLCGLDMVAMSYWGHQRAPTTAYFLCFHLWHGQSWHKNQPLFSSVHSRSRMSIDAPALLFRFMI